MLQELLEHGRGMLADIQASKLLRKSVIFFSNPSFGEQWGIFGIMTSENCIFTHNLVFLYAMRSANGKKHSECLFFLV